MHTQITTMKILFIYLFILYNIRMKPTCQNNIINAINDVRMLLNELRSNLSREEINRIREKFYKKEVVYKFLKEKDSLTNKEKRVLQNIDKYPKNISMHLKNLKNILKNYKNINMV